MLLEERVLLSTFQAVRLMKARALLCLLGNAKRYVTTKAWEQLWRATRTTASEVAPC